MAYFKLKGEVNLPGYPFDFHSHFAGILPVESKVTWGDNKDYLIPVHGTEDKIFRIVSGQELSLVGMIILSESESCAWPEKEVDIEQKKRQAQYKLFDLALEQIIEKNPFDKLLATSFDKIYTRGECAAENIYLACVLILAKLGEFGGFKINEDLIYQKVRVAIKEGRVDKDIDLIIRYFNKKIYTANEYTPFDDAYWSRSKARKGIYKDLFSDLTLAYLYQEGIICTQIATGADEIVYLNGVFERFRKEYGTSYKLLAHTANSSNKLEIFYKDLDEIKKLFEKDGEEVKAPHLVGIDLLGMETKNGAYIDFFKYLLKKGNAEVFDDYRPKGLKKIILHIHCGEGTGISEDNRSICGFFLKNVSKNVDHQAFFDQFGQYAYKCYCNTIFQEEDKEREKEAHAPILNELNKVSRLFEELFYNNNFVFNGLYLRRFDITTNITQSLVAYYARNNIMNLSHALSKEDQNDNRSFYGKLFCGDNPTFALRIGHGYYYRNYISEKYQMQLFDTNLGSNFITGASGLFDSAQEYRINRGFRHLNGYVATNTLIEAKNAIAYVGENRLKNSQAHYVDKLFEMDPFTLNNNEKTAFTRHLVDDHVCKGKALDHFIANIGFVLSDYFEKQVREYDDINKGGTKEDHNTRRREYFHILFAQVLNWRSYVLGADGQGVEHSNVQDEAVRMAIVLNYGLPSKNDLIYERSLKNMQDLFIKISQIYWEDTIYSPLELKLHDKRKITHLEGFDGPDSVMLIRTEKI